MPILREIGFEKPTEIYGNTLEVIYSKIISIRRLYIIVFAGLPAPLLVNGLMQSYFFNP